MAAMFVYRGVVCEVVFSVDSGIGVTAVKGLLGTMELEEIFRLLMNSIVFISYFYIIFHGPFILIY